MSFARRACSMVLIAIAIALAIALALAPALAPESYGLTLFGGFSDPESPTF